MKKIRLLTAWQQFPKGREFEVGTVGGMPAGAAQMLVARGFAEEVKEQPRGKVRAGMRAGADYLTR